MAGETDEDFTRQGASYVMDTESVLRHPDLSNQAKALFLLLLVNADRGGGEIPERHWWTDRTTDDLLDEMADFDVIVVGQP